MTKNLNTLCCLLTSTNIDYTIISANEISIEAVALSIIPALNAETISANSPEVERTALWDTEHYLHITEDKNGEFSLTILSNNTVDEVE